MKRRILSIFVVLAMMMSVLPMGVFAASEGEESEESSEVIAFNEQADAESEHFTLHAVDGQDPAGWYARKNDNGSITIEAKYADCTIKRIDAVIGYYDYHYSEVIYSSGTKVETDDVYNGNTVHVTDINSDKLTISCIYAFCQFKNITVYYTQEHNFTGDYKGNGDGTHCRKCVICGEYGKAESHDLTGDYKANGDGTHSRQCVICGEYGATENHQYAMEYIDNGDGTHSRQCLICDGIDATTEHTLTDYYMDNGDGTHSRRCTICDAHDQQAQSHNFVNGVCSTCGAWDGKAAKEVISFNYKEDAESEHFTLHCASTVDRYGWYVTPSGSIKIKAKDDTYMIESIDAVVTDGKYYRMSEYSSGKRIENDTVNYGTIIHVTGINSTELTINARSLWFQFKDITVHYYVHEHDFTGDAKDNGDGTHSFKCSGCAMYGNPENHRFKGEYCFCGAKEPEKEDLEKAITEAVAEINAAKTEKNADIAEDGIDRILWDARTIDEVKAIKEETLLLMSCERISITKDDITYEMHGNISLGGINVKCVNGADLWCRPGECFRFTGYYTPSFAFSLENGGEIFAIHTGAGRFSGEGWDGRTSWMNTGEPKLEVFANATGSSEVTSIEIFYKPHDSNRIDLTDGKAYAQKDSNTAIMRLMWKLEADENAQITNVGAYVIPWGDFTDITTDSRTKSVQYVNPTTADGQALKSGNTFAVDVTNIPTANYDTTIWALPFVNGNVFASQLLNATVNGADINK